LAAYNKFYLNYWGEKIGDCKNEILVEIITEMSINEIQCLKEEELNNKRTVGLERKKLASIKKRQQNYTDR
jgi:hypothetical protein